MRTFSDILDEVSEILRASKGTDHAPRKIYLKLSDLNLMAEYLELAPFVEDADVPCRGYLWGVPIYCQEDVYRLATVRQVRIPEAIQ